MLLGWVVATTCLVPAVCSPPIKLGFTEQFHRWASPYKPWKGPTPLPGVCGDRCSWAQDGDADYYVHPGFALSPDTGPVDGLPEGAKLLLYCMEPTCVVWAGKRHDQVAAVVGWHPEFTYWVPMECAAVVSLAHQDRRAHLGAVGAAMAEGHGLPPGKQSARVPGERRAPVASVLTNCLSWRREFLHDLGAHIPVDHHGSCLRNVADEESKVLLTSSAEALAEPMDASGTPFTLQANKLQAIRDYPFVIAYENSFAAHYITEKVYDALLAGVVPVYLGAPNIRDYVNPDCVVFADEFGGVRDGGLTMDNDALARRLRALLTNTTQLARMQACEQPVPKQGPHVRRCVELLRDPKVSPLAAPSGDRVSLPAAMLGLPPSHESTMFFCSVCDAAHRHQGDTQSK